MPARSRLPFALVSICLLLSSPVLAQEDTGGLSGRVSDASDGRPLPGVHVYLAQTTIGTTTDAEGRFEIRGVSPSAYEVVASMVGYATQTHPVDFTARPRIDLQFTLAPAVVRLDEVRVSGRIDRRWRRLFRHFERAFVGTSRFAREAEILNPHVLDFDPDPWDGSFTARASEPLIVESRGLGYRVRYELEHFFADPETEAVRFNGRVFFEELTPRDSGEARRWADNRETVFLGSVPHFLWALTQDRLAKEGFLIQTFRQHSPMMMRPDEMIRPAEPEGTFTLSFGETHVTYENRGGHTFQGSTVEESRLRMDVGSATLFEDGFWLPVFAIHSSGPMGRRRVGDQVPREYVRQYARTRVPEAAHGALPEAAAPAAPTPGAAADTAADSATDSATFTLREADRVRLAEAFRLADHLGDRVWPGWSAASFAVLLVAPDAEFLMRHPAPSGDFRPLGYDSLLASDVYARHRTFPPNLLAAFPAIAGSDLPTVVVGQVEQTGGSSTSWMLTLLHEHFHQYQTAQADYYERAAALGLSGGDTSGMWMLNYPFPYADPAVQEAFDRFARALVAALNALDSPYAEELLEELTEARDALRARLSPADRRYMAFQLWQEGVARYVELRVAELAADVYTPTGAFAALPGFRPFAEIERELRAGIVADLATMSLGERKRVGFYAAGAALALLLDASEPGWRTRYFERMFDLDGFAQE